MSFKAVVISCLVSALSGFAVGYYTGGEYIRRIFVRLNCRMTDEEIRKYQEMIYGKDGREKELIDALDDDLK